MCLWLSLHRPRRNRGPGGGHQEPRACRAAPARCPEERRGRPGAELSVCVLRSAVPITRDICISGSLKCGRVHGGNKPPTLHTSLRRRLACVTGVPPSARLLLRIRHLLTEGVPPQAWWAREKAKNPKRPGLCRPRGLAPHLGPPPVGGDGGVAAGGRQRGWGGGSGRSPAAAPLLPQAGGRALSIRGDRAEGDTETVCLPGDVTPHTLGQRPDNGSVSTLNTYVLHQQNDPGDSEVWRQERGTLPTAELSWPTRSGSRSSARWGVFSCSPGPRPQLPG